MLQQTSLDPALASVFITEELWRRAPKKVDYYQEKMALLDLAAKMATEPEKVLPRFVDLAMQMGDGTSAGLSLFEPDPAPGVFRWTHLRGELARFNGATTPRNYSPCGVTLDQNSAVLTCHSELAYTWISDTGTILPEVLLVPLHGSNGTLSGTLWIVSDTKGHFDMGHVQAITDLAAFVEIALAMQRNKELTQSALDDQKMLAREMDHRVKNIFAMTESLVRLTARREATKEDMTKSLLGRMSALAKAHSLARKSSDDASPAIRVADLKSLVEIVLKPYELPDGNASRFALSGPDVILSTQAANSIALVLHELATNAAKYGALAGDAGSVDVAWEFKGDAFNLRWIERGGPEIADVPTNRGFGSTLAETMVSRQLSGSLSYDWQRGGVEITIRVPEAKLT